MNKNNSEDAYVHTDIYSPVRINITNAFAVYF